ncbi:MAG: hypothetical protein ACJ8BW_10340 [Ktedonobacteraceae bacterium]
MILDNTFNFNYYGAQGNFDDHEARLRHLLRQDVMPTLEGGCRHLLYACQVCKQPWYTAGRHEYARLTAEQQAFLGVSLHADITTLHLLPRALCPICSTVYLGGMFTIGEYPHHRGYRFLWESATPRRIRLLAMVCRRKEHTMDTLLQMAPDPCTEPALPTVRSVLAWIEETCPGSEAMRAYTAEESQRLARRCPPRNAANGTTHRWCGYTWDDTCPVLGGEVLVSLAVAVLPFAPAPLNSLRLSWQVLAGAMRTVL